MASPPLPPQLETLTGRSFAFFPAIINIEHNEWQVRQATWSEVLVTNVGRNLELWIPRRYFGEISTTGDPLIIVGLNRELEFKGGAIFPYQKRVLQMPGMVGAKPLDSAGEDDIIPEKISRRLDPGDKSILKLMAWVIGCMLVVYVLLVNWNRIGDPVQKTILITTKDRRFLELTSRDDYFAVVNKLGGQPAVDRWQSEGGLIQYRALTYPDRRYTVILMGSDRPGAHYIGALDDKWVPIHYVESRAGGDTASLLRSLKPF